jgi:hypothetical protein
MQLQPSEVKGPSIMERAAEEVEALATATKVCTSRHEMAGRAAQRWLPCRLSPSSPYEAHALCVGLLRLCAQGAVGGLFSSSTSQSHRGAEDDSQR